MKIEFYVNDALPLGAIVDSMQLDSGQEIASMKVNEYKIFIKTEGFVKVFYRGDCYKTPSKFPDELAKKFAEGYSCEDPDIDVVENNWFELFVYKNDKFLHSDVIELQNETPNTLFELLLETYFEVEEGSL